MKRLLILSGKGGTGKTTTAAAFIRFSGAQAIADCDVDAPNLHLVTQQEDAPICTDFFGGEKAAIDPNRCIACDQCRQHCRFDAIKISGSRYQVDEFACEGCGVCAYVCPHDAVALHPDIAGSRQLYAGNRVFSTASLKMGRGNSGKLVSEVKLAMMKNVKNAALAIIDGSPGIGCPVISSISGVDLVLIVAEPSLSGISDLKRLVQTIRSFQTNAAVCINKWDVSPERTREIESFCNANQIPFVGRIPYDPAASHAINAGLSVADLDCPARDALKQIYETTSLLLAK